MGGPRGRARPKWRRRSRRCAACASSSIGCGWTIASARRVSIWSSSSSANCRRPTCRPGEDETLAAERQLLRSADTIQRLCGESYAELYDTEDAALVVARPDLETGRRAGRDRSAVRAVPRCPRRHQGAARGPRVHAARFRRRHRRVAGAAAAGRGSPRADRAAQAQAWRHARGGDRPSRSAGRRAPGADRRTIDASPRSSSSWPTRAARSWRRAKQLSASRRDAAPTVCAGRSKPSWPTWRWSGPSSRCG